MKSEGWKILMTDSVAAAAGPLGADTMFMLRLEQELQAQDIEVAWDPFRPGEGFQGFYANLSTHSSSPSDGP